MLIGSKNANMEDLALLNRKAYPYLPRNDLDSVYNRKISAKTLFTQLK